jgi:hypothetical protein
MTHPNPTPPPAPSSLDRALILAFIICLVLNLAAYFLVFAPPRIDRVAGEDEGPEQSYRFAPLSIDEARLQQARDQRHGAARPDRVVDEIARLQARVRAANLLQFPGEDPVTAEQVERIEREIFYLANEVLPGTGLPGFVVSGESLFTACQEGLEELLLALRRGNLDLDRARRDPPSPRFDAYRENCGNALEMLVDHGLVTPDGRWRQAHGPRIFEVLMRFRWAHIIHSHLPARAQLSRYEYELLLRWRVEDPYAFPASQRRQFLEELKAILPDYDTNLAQARIDAEGREWSEIIAIFEALAQAHPSNRLYKTILADVRKAASQS